MEAEDTEVLDLAFSSIGSDTLHSAVYRLHQSPFAAISTAYVQPVSPEIGAIVGQDTACLTPGVVCKRKLIIDLKVCSTIDVSTRPWIQCGKW
jgi:hypothetical protein